MIRFISNRRTASGIILILLPSGWIMIRVLRPPHSDAKVAHRKWDDHYAGLDARRRGVVCREKGKMLRMIEAVGNLQDRILSIPPAALPMMVRGGG